MILIRPLLRANAERGHRAQIIVLFIILVANVGGAPTAWRGHTTKLCLLNAEHRGFGIGKVSKTGPIWTTEISRCVSVEIPSYQPGDRPVGIQHHQRSAACG